MSSIPFSERIECVRGNMVLVKCVVNSRFVTPEQTNPFTLSNLATVVKVGPGAYNSHLGRRLPIEYADGTPVCEGDLVMIDPQAVWGPTELADEKMALIRDDAIYAKITPQAPDDEAVRPSGLVIP